MAKIKKLKTHLAWFAFEISIIPLIFVILIIFPYMQNSLKNQVFEFNQTHANLLADNIKEHVDIVYKTLLSSKNSLNFSSDLGLSQAQQYLQETVNDYPYFESIQIINSKGRILTANKEIASYIGNDLSYQKFVSIPQNEKKPYWSSLFLSPISGKSTLALTIPFDDNMIVGYLKISSFENFDYAVKNNIGTVVAILDSEGNYISHTDIEKANQRQNEKYFAKFKDNLNKGISSFILNYNGQNDLFSVKELVSPNWYVVVFKKETDVFAFYYRIIGIILLTMIVIIAVSYFRVSTRLGKIIQTLRNIKNSMSKANEGNYEVKFETTVFEELNEISLHFNNVVNSVRENIDRITKRESELKESYERECAFNKMARQLINVPKEDVSEILKNSIKIYLEISKADAGFLFVLNEDNLNFEHNVIVGFERDNHARKEGTRRDVEIVSQLLNVIGIKNISIFCRENECEYSLLKELTSDDFVNFTLIPVSISGVVKGIVGSAWRENNKTFETLHLDNMEVPGSVFSGSIEREHKNNELRHSKELAEYALKAKSEFLANMSHEIRTPMTGILGMTDILMISELSEEHKKMLKVIKESSKTLLSIINDILDLSKIETGNFQLMKEEFKPSELIDETSRLFRSISIKSQIELEISIDQGVPKVLCGDALRLKQILTNLLGNAFKFTEKGKVTLMVTKVNENEDETTLCFAVEDTGIGIPQDKMEGLFSFFNQLDQTITKKYGGTGLGLAISRKLVEMMDGKILVESEVGKGSTFYFTAVLENVEEPFVKMESESMFSMIMGNIPGKMRNILIVEDDINSQMLLCKLLSNKKINITTLDNGKKAMELIESQKFNLVILDIQLPELSGFDIIQTIRENADEKIRKIPAIAITAYALKEDRERCLNMGFDEYLSKPLNIEKFRDLIFKYLLK